jgi:two-component system response regulator TctD
MRVLIIEDNSELAQLIAKRLDQSGFEPDRVETVEHAQHAIDAVDYAAIVLDLGLPGEDGLTLLRKLRGEGRSTPVLIASARNGLEDRVKGLREGADDYLAKPFSVDELIARLHALIRRPRKLLGNVLVAGNVTVDNDKHQVKVDDRMLPMRLREAVLLDLLIRHKNSVVPRRYFGDQLFGISGLQDVNAIEVYIHRIRKQLTSAHASVGIHNIRGVGYMLREETSIGSPTSEPALLLPVPARSRSR